METKMKEMLVAAGIVTEEMCDEVNNIVENALNAMKVHELTDEEIDAQAKHLKTYVGQFVKVGGQYGMIDEVIPSRYGCRLGFVYSTPNMWCGRVVDEHDVSPVDGKEIAKAIESAIGYYRNESADLTNRLAMHYEIDIPHIKRIQEMINECLTWLTELDTLQDGGMFIIDETDRVDEDTLALLKKVLAED